MTLQAMACGKAVVLTRTRGLFGGELLRHGENCHLVPPGDLGALREALDVVGSDLAYRARLGAAARRTVESHFTSDRMAEDIGAIVEQVRR